MIMDGISSQEGGMKVVMKNAKGENVAIREITEKRQFISIFSNTLDIQIISVNSLTGFILRITLPVDDTPFRSDIFSESGDLMTAAEHKRPDTGRVVTQHVLKCCIVQPNIDPVIEQFTTGRDKGTCTAAELLSEYNAQANVYDATLAYGGMPVCPDVYALMEFNLAEFREVFFPDTLSPGHAGLPSIGTDIFKDNRVFQYLLRQLEAIPPPVAGQPHVDRRVGIILMESLPPSYEPLMQLYSTFSSVSRAGFAANPIFGERKRLFDQATEHALSICAIVFYRVGYIPLDAHLGNWMYDITQPLEQFKVRSIDFGRVLPRLSPGDVDNIVRYVRSYLRLFNPRDKGILINGLGRLLGVNPGTMQTAEECGTKIGEIFIALNKLIRRNQNGSILWNPTGPTDSIITRPAGPSRVEQRMQVDSCMKLIHKIFFLIALVDSCHNSVKARNRHFCQLRDTFSSLFDIKCDNLSEMVDHRVHIDLVEYLKRMADYNDRVRVIQSYQRIRDYIGNFLRVSPQRGLFIDNFYEDPSPDSPRDPLVVAAELAAIPPPPVPPPPPPLPPRKTSVKKSSSLSSSGHDYEQFISGYAASHPPVPPPVPPPPSSGAGGGGSKKKLRKSMKPKKSIKTKLSKFLKTKKNKNHNRYRKNKRYRL
jgi:hypothetical protein